MKLYNNRLLAIISILFLLNATEISAKISLDNVVYTAQDSIKVEQFLADAYKEKPENAVLFFARKFIDVPYVAKTLDRDATQERVVVNLTEMDCTTFVETSVALARTFYNNKRTFCDYVEELAALRYDGARIAYEHRNHYFSGWIMWNTERGAVAERQLGSLSVAKQQRILVNYMSLHPNAYPQIKANPSVMQPKIKEMEARVSGGTCYYIPKASLNRSGVIKPSVADGDIIVITTNKKGLDCSHIGFAVWHSDGLHLLNASQIHGRVIDEPMTLYQYMQRHPSQTGIRVVEVKKRK